MSFSVLYPFSQPASDEGGDGEEHVEDLATVKAGISTGTISELAELLGVFRLLAARSLLPCESSVALKTLVFPTALSNRR